VATVAEQGTLASPRIDELSGLAVSRADPEVLWGHNDTGDGPWLYRVGRRGEDLGRVAVPGARAVDWEDIAAFDHASGPALLVADTGDNLGVRGTVTLYAVSDPGREGEARLLWRLDFEYPDGPRDCEAVAVDPRERQILLLSKRDQPPRLYALPLPAQPPAGRQRARFLGTLATAPPPAPTLGERLAAAFLGFTLDAPTAFDISADGATAVVLTLRHAYLFRRDPGAGWAAALAGSPAPIELPPLGQAEAAALSADGRTLWLGSEGRPGRWARLELAPVPHNTIPDIR
jgi:hypothetical protein